MLSRRLLDTAIAEISENVEQFAAVLEKGHCAVIAGPGSGKTKTLTAAMARTLLEDVQEPRGVACITYNNECAIELEERLQKLGIQNDGRIFIGTVHSFAMSQVLGPYARIALPELQRDFRLATRDECRAAVEHAHAESIGGPGNPHWQWDSASTKRRRDVDRQAPAWFERSPEFIPFIEAYERELRSKGLIDFDDMPLLAIRLIRQNDWIKHALNARFSSIFVDEYQDLGHALHDMVLELCFGGSSRLFAVGDTDQSIYGFTGANPELLDGLTKRSDVRTIRLRLNYRCGTKIIAASMGALGQERGYEGKNDAREGTVDFVGVKGGLAAQAQSIFETIIPGALSRGTGIDDIAVLYRTAEQGNAVADAARNAGIAIVRADNQALVPRSSRLGRFVEASAAWVVGGWQDADPPFQRLVREASSIVYGPCPSEEERQTVQLELCKFLTRTIGQFELANDWLREMSADLFEQWKKRSVSPISEWDQIDRMIDQTNPQNGREDLLLSHFGGRIEGSGRLVLSTLHSAKGREFDIVILFAMNNDVIPTARDSRTPAGLREARRLFYVGVTRPRHELYIVFQERANSPWVKALYDRIST